ncbi:MAG: LpxD N-terminal domain-containing protein [Flavobacteriales bacterium]
MKFSIPFTLESISNQFNCLYVGDSALTITGINEIHRVVAGDIVFVDHPKYYEKALQSNATVIIIDKRVECPEGKGLMITEQPFELFNQITRYGYAQKQQNTHNYSSQFPGVFIGKNVSIGSNVQLAPGVCIMDDTVIGNHVVIGPNTVVGHAAFYYKKSNQEYTAMFSCGNVEIADHVEIGASCTIDRGVTDVTYIGAGTKIDNLVQIGHDTRIGENCLFASHVGIAGCVDIGNRVTMWGQVGCASGIQIGDDTVILAQSGISKNLDGNTTYFGSPCSEVREKFKEMAAVKQLPDFLRKHQ